MTTYDDWGDDQTMAEGAERVTEESAQQRVIDTVLERHGGQPVGVVLPALREAWAAQGFEMPPHQWFEAVAVEISRGSTYIVGPELSDRD